MATRMALWIAGAGMALASALPAYAQDAAMSMAPLDPGAAQPARGVFSLSSSPQPQQPAAETSSDPLNITPDLAALASIKAQPAPKLANVPLPPIPVRPKAEEQPAGAMAAPAQATQVVALATPPAPTGGGFLAWLGSLNQPQNEEGEAAGSRRSPAAKKATLDLTDPYHPKRMSPGDSRDDDLEDEETRKLVEKQVPEVEIACLKRPLLDLIHQAGEHFKGTPIITSGYRNRGRRGSYHRKCEAADFFITGVSGSQLTAFLRSLPEAGGVGTYCHTKSVHIDTGEARNWHQCGFRRSFALRAPKVAGIGSR